MKVVPVLDLMNGCVVRGIGGRRDEYCPVQSCLEASADPLQIAAVFHEKLGLRDLYVADLDGIMHERPQLELYRSLVEAGAEIIVDAGVREHSLAQDIIEAGASAVIAGLETIPGPEFLSQICRKFGSDRVIFSLDLSEGRVLGRCEEWQTADPFEIAVAAVERGITQIIVLDLAGVGTGQGLITIPLCIRLMTTFPELQVITGGGIRNVDDLYHLSTTGIAGVLIASALHNGAIGCDAIAKIACRSVP